MTRPLIGIAITALVFCTSACKSHYRISDIRYTRILIDNRLDATPDPDAADLLRPYKEKVDSVMSPVVGSVDHDMSSERPESELSNLLSDILVWAGKNYHEQPVLGIYNMGGIRASLSKGQVTYGDILDIAPFENKICFMTLTGEALTELLTQIAARGGEGISHGTEIMMNKDLKLISARLHGNEIDPKGSYRIATIDYLAQGNDGLQAFKKGTKVVAPKESSNNLRFIIMEYFKEKASKGETVSAKVEGRIRLVE